MTGKRGPSSLAGVTSVRVIFLQEASVRALRSKTTLNKTKQAPAGWKALRTLVCVWGKLCPSQGVGPRLTERWFASERWGRNIPKKETGEKQQARLIPVVPSKFQQWKSLFI